MNFTPLIVCGAIGFIMLSISVLILSLAKFNSIEIDNKLKEFNLNRLKYNEKN